MVALAALVVAAACNHCQQPVDTTTVAPRQCQLDIQAHLRFTHEVSQIMKQFKCRAAVLLCSLVLKMRGLMAPEPIRPENPEHYMCVFQTPPDTF